MHPLLAVSAMVGTLIVSACVATDADPLQSTTPASESESPDSIALLASVRAGNYAALERAIAADLEAAVLEALSGDGALFNFDPQFEFAECHDAPSVWFDNPPTGICLLRVSALNVAASYALIVPAQGPVSFAFLDMAIE